MEIQLCCQTQGASVVWTDEDGDDVYWQLYTAPLRLDAGEEIRLRAKAVRIGYADSEERHANFRCH
jgi:hypothetical protein